VHPKKNQAKNQCLSGPRIFSIIITKDSDIKRHQPFFEGKKGKFLINSTEERVSLRAHTVYSHARRGEHLRLSP
jgi:hypothetical protein